MKTQLTEKLKEQAKVVYDYAPFYGDMDKDPKPLYKVDEDQLIKVTVEEVIKLLKRGDSGFNDFSERLVRQHFGIR